VKGDRQAHLRAAESLARAVKLSPGEAEPALRLAHVKLLQADAAHARQLLEPLVAEERDSRVAYLARLFIAASHQRLGRPQESNRRLEEGLRVMPSGQSAYVALASNLHASGDRNGAAAVLRRMLAAPAAPDDPWVGYRFGQFWVPGPLLAELREEARRP
jgi:thioredoxin-like negative regulator of GroEL